MEKLIILEDQCNIFTKKNYLDNFKKYELDENSLLTGNILFNIFNFVLGIDKEEFEIYSLNNNKNTFENIYEILISTNNKLSLYKNKIYYLSDLEETINILKNNKFSKEYQQFCLSNNLKKNNDIFDFIDKLDMNEFHKVYKSQYELIKYIDYKPLMPVNYCINKLNTSHNKIAREVINTMINLLDNLEYRISPKLFDDENINNIYELIEKSLEREDFYLILRIITIFKLNINNSNYIFFLLRNKKYLEKIVKLIIEKNIYDYNTLLNFLLVLNKVNLFNIYYKKDIKIDFNDLIKYFIQYHSIISFYYVIDNYKDEIKITSILPNDFFQIYVNLTKNRENYNDLLLDYFKLIINKDDTQCNILLEEIDKKNFNEKILFEFINVCVKENKYDYFKNLIGTHNKDIFLWTNILFKILDNKQEELFYYAINLFNEEEIEIIFNKLRDKDDNSLYHYICKNSICLGYKINNKIRNSKGYKPLDLCKISHKYYKI